MKPRGQQLSTDHRLAMCQTRVLTGTDWDDMLIDSFVTCWHSLRACAVQELEGAKRKRASPSRQRLPRHRGARCGADASQKGRACLVVGVHLGLQPSQSPVTRSSAVLASLPLFDCCWHEQQQRRFNLHDLLFAHMCGDWGRRGHCLLQRVRRSQWFTHGHACRQCCGHCSRPTACKCPRFKDRWVDADAAVLVWFSHPASLTTLTVSGNVHFRIPLLAVWS